ncbi:MAG: hypothetical protein UY55_C0005G0036 [Candidatus Jorgensenbacteria bacterium GW2011_GWB1_50_10]|uniref:Uncharacterized protein n=1 Tax=Candidatus Jorgensenbacteria bacterium GW2011_GWB1_50_10 TaxID=1618665 RepID=A0A0G1W7M3_9BACT|nr:MAG: hypothetical protein UY55_C0005G0036 [Candidatus Jorgensenbacteria bacterium GW2011_GWB1_50_10]
MEHEDLLDKGSYRKARGLLAIWLQRLHEEYERELLVGLSAFSVGVLLGVILGRTSKE